MLVYSATKQDFGLAFQFCNEFQFSPNEIRQELQSMIVSRQESALEWQGDFLRALRKETTLISAKDKQSGENMWQEGLNQLFSKVSESGFEKSMQWFSSIDATEEQKNKMIEGLSYNGSRYGNAQEDIVKWLNWLSGQSDKGESAAQSIIHEWAKEDSKAAGEWISNAPAGSLKEAATNAYLDMIELDDPEVAVKWVKTLPENKQKKAMKNIYWRLQQQDKTAAQTFAELHGISQSE